MTTEKRGGWGLQAARSAGYHMCVSQAANVSVHRVGPSQTAAKCPGVHWEGE